MQIETRLEYSAVGLWPNGTEWRSAVLLADGEYASDIMRRVERMKPVDVGELRLEQRRVTVQTGSWHPV